MSSESFCHVDTRRLRFVATKFLKRMLVFHRDELDTLPADSSKLVKSHEGTPTPTALRSSATKRNQDQQTDKSTSTELQTSATAASSESDGAHLEIVENHSKVIENKETLVVESKQEAKTNKTIEKDSKSRSHKNSKAKDPAPTIRTPPSVGNHSTFPYWDDVDLTQVGTCGWKKCFFQSRTNETLGYLVLSEKEIGRTKAAMELARDIHNKFGAKHLELDYTVDTVSDEFKAHINSLRNTPSLAKQNIKPAPIVTPDRDVMIIRVIRAPNPSLFFGATWYNCYVLADEMTEFKKQVSDVKAFERNLTPEIERLKKVLKYVPKLGQDFQAIIDANGSFYYIDLEINEELADPPAWRQELVAGRIQQVIDFVAGASPLVDCSDENRLRKENEESTRKQNRASKKTQKREKNILRAR